MKTCKYPFVWNSPSALNANLVPSADLIVELEIESDYALFLDEEMPKLARSQVLSTSVLEHCCKLTLPQGLIIELGVCSGTSVNEIARIHPNRVIYGFDSFEGLPENWELIPKGWFKRDSKPDVRSNVSIVEGWFHETLPSFLNDNLEPVAFLHVDSDLYSSAKTALRLLAPRFQKGTIIVFDEIINEGPFSALHEMKAWYETVREYNIEFEWIGRGCSTGVLLFSPEFIAENGFSNSVLETAAAVKINSLHR